ncbi:MAG TPA: GGDEF domain-containing protein [Acidimicrobiales bacterium]
MTALSDEPTAGPIPADVAVRLLRALDRAPSAVISLIDPDLTTRWISASADWVIDTDPDGRMGRESMERVHPDDIPKLLQGLAQLRAAAREGGDDPPVIEPLRYRKRRRDGTWIAMEAMVQNLLSDPVVNGLMIISRPTGGVLDSVSDVVDLLVAEAPLPEVLAACARIVPDYLGAAAVIGLVDGTAVVGVDESSPAAELVVDERWWRPALADGRARTLSDFAGFPPELATRARAGGFISAWAIPLPDASSGALMGCVMVWVSSRIEHGVGTEHSLQQAIRLASLVLGEQRRHHTLRREAVTDPLTRAGNRSALRQRLDGVTGNVTVALVDLDDFKPVNDTYGHDTGDAVLQVVAERLMGTVREDDLVARFGGDEFAIVFAEGTTLEGATPSIDRIVAAIDEPVVTDRGTILVSASVGLASGPATEVVQQADAALYEVKRAKRLPSTRRGAAAR